MSVANQLYQLQEVDLEIESGEQALRKMVGQLGESQTVAGVRSKLASEQKRLEELKRQQHSAEGDVDDLVSKIKVADEELYSGRIKNPKELANLQHEVDLLKAKRDKLETSALETMDQIELAETSVAAISSELAKLEAEWQSQQQQLTTDIEALKSKLSELKSKRELLVSEVDPQAVESYDRLRKQKGQAVANVEQGICRGCRISLPFNDLQRVRSGNLVQCSSCGRILFLP